MLYITVPLRSFTILKRKGSFMYLKFLSYIKIQNYAAKIPNLATSTKNKLVSSVTVSSPEVLGNEPSEIFVHEENDSVVDTATEKQNPIISKQTSDNSRAINKKSNITFSLGKDIYKELSYIINSVDSKPLIFISKHKKIIDLEKVSKNSFLQNNGCVLSTTEDTYSLEYDNLLKKNDLKRKLTLVNALNPNVLEWQEQVLTLKRLPHYYMKLSKIRLTGLVVITTLAGYIMAPNPIDVSTASIMIIGTGLTSCAANAINQFLEIPYDSQMARTKHRVLVKSLISPLHAVSFATISAICGLFLLYSGINELTAALGAINLVLYTSVYTPLKRYSILNTWVGSIVGAIPPVMGWAACTGSIDPGALIMAAILYSWQFPHFNALSWNLRQDYSRAGYRMMSVTNPDLCRRTALRHSCAIVLYSLAAPYFDLTTWTFAVDSLPLNLYLVYSSWKFYQEADSNHSRKLFRLSLIHLPGLILLMFISKKFVRKDEKDAR
ncbi:protoheme IX farnesyltransferase, mitochondrial [Centruroides vittatus]|uniref:protoheme IX farnesyltransferase, mitochondrial n=1 Tax=Centruroides vittatus TaxID=120091 RepID=UPI00350F5A8E